MFKKLFESISIGQVEVKNRIVMAPNVVHYAGSSGEVTEQMISYYEERAKGGTGLIIIEAMLVTPEGRLTACNAKMYPDELIPGWSRLVDAVQLHGARIGVQLAHSGSQAPATVKDPVSASAVPRKNMRTPRELTINEIEEIIESWGEAARRAKSAGFDFVQIHGTHGYLVSQFCSPLTNQRTDKYGTDRNLFAIEILKRIKEKCGQDYPVIYRLNSCEFVDGGITIEDAKITAKKLEEAGIDAIDVTGGTYDTLDYIIPSMYNEKPGFWEFIKNAKEIKEVVSVPIISGGLISSPEEANKAIEEGYLDMIFLGRGLIADPEWANKARKGKTKEIRKCIACNDGCIGRLFAGKTSWCSVNSFNGYEYRFGSQPHPAPIKKKVVVVGGGPGGMEAALIAAQKGHKVTLIEKDKKLGGTIKIASVPIFKKKLEYITEWYSVQLPKAGVKINFGKKATADAIIKMKPDAVILAVGANPLIPKIQGVDKAGTAEDALIGKVKVGKKIVIIGGGLTGCETALYFSQQDKEVTVVEASDQIVLNTNAINGIALGKMLATSKIKILTGLQIEKIDKKEVTTVDKLGNKTNIPADTVLFAVGRVSNRDLQTQLKGQVELYTIGDCVSPASITEAVHQAFGVSMFL